MAKHLPIIGLIVAGASLFVVSQAGAQSVDTMPARPAAPAETPTSARAHQSTDLTVSLFGAYDQNALADVTPGSQGALLESGFYSGLAANVAYSWQGRKFQFGATAGSSGRYYGDVNDFVWVSHSVGVGFTEQFARRSSISVNQSVLYTPSYLYSLFASVADEQPGDVPPSGTDYGFDNQRGYMYSTAVNVSHGLSRRGTLSFSSDYRYTDFTAPTLVRNNNLESYDIGGRYTYGLSRGVGLHLGYTYRKGGYAALSDVREHMIDVGIDYNRPLSRSRKTVLTFSFGSTVVSGPFEQLPGSASSHQIRAIGNATLRHAMGRTWYALVTYDRGLTFVEGIIQPVFTDAVTTGVGGFLSRRVDLSMSAGYVNGAGAVVSTAAGLRTYTGNARLRYAIKRSLAMYGEYLFFKYDFNRGLGLTPGLSSNLDRNGGRVGLTFWFPERHR